jgi:hypothetical protein
MRTAPRIVEAGLWLIAAACGFWATLWVLGVNGFGRLSYDSVPRWLDPLSLYGANAQWVARPATSVTPGGADYQRVLDFYASLSGPPRPHYASLVPDTLAFLQTPTTAQRACYVLLHVAVYAVVAGVAVSLARLVAASRADSPFTHRNGRLLQVIGLVLLVGSPLASLAEWTTLRWMVESSSVGDRVSVYGFGLSSVPIWTMLVGAAVLVLADVWKRGVQMADDVRGLV